MYRPALAGQSETVQNSAPLTGANVAVSNEASLLAIAPAGPLAALTVTMPAAPSNGRRVTVTTTQAITALTLAGGSFVGGVTTLAIGGFAAFCYVSALGQWIRCG
jgi:hypothetical protein